MRSPEQASREVKPAKVTEQQREALLNKEESGVHERPREPEKKNTAEENVQEFLRNSSKYGLKAKMLAEELTELQRKTLVVARDPVTQRPLETVKVMTAETIAQYRSDLQELDRWLADMATYAENIKGHLTPHQRDQIKYTLEQNEAIRERITEALEASRSRRRLKKEPAPEEPREAAFVSKETQEDQPFQRERVSPWAPPKEKPKPKGFWNRVKSWFS